MVKGLLKTGDVQSFITSPPSVLSSLSQTLLLRLHHVRRLESKPLPLQQMILLPLLTLLTSHAPAPGIDICSPVLAFIKAARLRFDATSIKKLLLDNFPFSDLSAAMKLLWDNCQAKLSDLDFVFHVRRDSDK